MENVTQVSNPLALVTFIIKNAILVREKANVQTQVSFNKTIKTRLIPRVPEVKVITDAHRVRVRLPNI